MILPSLNSLNCWDTLKQILHNVTGNGKRDGLKSILMKQWAISSQAPFKNGEGSSTKRSNLNLYDMVKLSRMGRCFLFAIVLVMSLLPLMVEAGSQEENIRNSQGLVEISRSMDKEPYDNKMEIKNFGDTITIDTIPTIVVEKYTKNQQINSWQNVDSDTVKMTIDRATIFKFKMDSKKSPIWQ